MTTDINEITVEIIFDDDVDDALPLYRKYPGQSEAQKAYVEINCKNETLDAAYDAEIGNAVTMDEHHGHVLSFECRNSLSGDEVMQLLESILPMAQRVIDGYTSELDSRGDNMVGRFTDDADSAIDEITAAIAFDAADDMDYGVWSAENFLLNDTPDELGITGKSTDDELDAIARELTADAASYNPPILADPDEIASELCHWRDKLAAG